MLQLHTINLLNKTLLISRLSVRLAFCSNLIFPCILSFLGVHSPLNRLLWIEIALVRPLVVVLALARSSIGPAPAVFVLVNCPRKIVFARYFFHF